MDVQALRQLKPELDLFLERYAAWFGRDETQDHANRFVQGLLLGGDRRSVENIAEAIDGCVVRSLQKFIAQSPWSDDRVVEELQRHVSEVLGDADASLNVDETGFPKKGTKSVGVKRQYAGCLGRTDNCQVGVCVNYRSAAGHTLIDRRLFLPEEWAADYPRREEAGVPEAVVFRTKPELAVEMVQQAVEARFALPLGDGGQRLRQQPDLRAGHPGAGQVVCRRYLRGCPGVVDRAGGDSRRHQGATGSGHQPAPGGDQTRTGRRGGGAVAGPCLEAHRRRRRESGAADLRVCLLVGLVQ